MQSNYIPTACPHDCPSTCALEVERIDSKTIGKVRGAKENPYTAGVICTKVSQYRERVHNPNRLMYPLKRVGPKGEGRFSRITWDEALGEVVEKFKAVTAEYGPEAVWPYFFAGTMGLLQRDCIDLLRNEFGYSRQDLTICTTLGRTGWLAGTGVVRGVVAREMADADLIVIWGGNPVSTQVNVMTHVMRARKTRNAKIVVIDPYRTPTAELADMHLALKPGTDGALACAVMNILFGEGFEDSQYTAKYTDISDKLRDHIASKNPHWASKITGLDVKEIESFARLYGKTKRSYIRVGYGFTRSRNGSVNMHAVSCLPAVTGAWQYKGGGAMHANAGMYNVDQKEIRGLDLINPKTRVLDMSQVGPILTGDPKSLKGGIPVKAMIVQNCNPAEVAPETNKVIKGMKREDLFLCVHEQFMTATASYADIILPATMFLEHEDFYHGSGHVYIQVARKVIEAPGECRSNHNVISELGTRLGSKHPGFHSTAWDLIDRAMQSSGYPSADQALVSRWVDCSKSFEDMHFLNGFNFPDGKFRFFPDWASLGSNHKGMPSLPDHFDVIEKTTKEHPFRLVAAPARRFLNTSFTAMPSSIRKEGRPTALVHKSICKSLGLREGDRVRLGNFRGDLVIHVKPSEGAQTDTIVVEGIWPNNAFEEKVGINVLVGAEPGYPAGGAAFHDTAIWLKPL